jgi:hypothetical protein
MNLLLNWSSGHLGLDAYSLIGAGIVITVLIWKKKKKALFCYIIDNLFWLGATRANQSLGWSAVFMLLSILTFMPFIYFLIFETGGQGFNKTKVAKKMGCDLLRVW